MLKTCKRNNLSKINKISFWTEPGDHIKLNDIISSGDSLKFSILETDNSESEFPQRLISVMSEVWNEFALEDLRVYLEEENREVETLVLEIWTVEFTVYFRFVALCAKKGEIKDIKWYWSPTPSVHQIITLPEDGELDCGVTEILMNIDMDGTFVKCYIENIGYITELS